MTGVASDYALASATSIGVGGSARELWTPADVDELCDVVGRLRGRDPFFLGGGCNTLFPDGAFERPVVTTDRLRQLDIHTSDDSTGGVRVRAEAGVRLDGMVRATLESGLEGFEHLVGIPGTVGGAIVMNAGGKGGSFGERVVEVGIVSLASGELERRLGSEIPWRYRSWGLEGYAVAWAEFELRRGDVAELRRRAKETFHAKNRVQPLAHASAGCIFKNPPGDSAGALIDRSGLKGLRRGGAMVSEQHANFIVNIDGTASAADVLELIAIVRDRVQEQSGVRLEPEIVIAEASTTTAADA